MRKSFKDSLKALQADIHLANTLSVISLSLLFILVLMEFLAKFLCFWWKYIVLIIYPERRIWYCCMFLININIILFGRISYHTGHLNIQGNMMVGAFRWDYVIALVLAFFSFLFNGVIIATSLLPLASSGSLFIRSHSFLFSYALCYTQIVFKFFMQMKVWSISYIYIVLFFGV